MPIPKQPFEPDREGPLRGVRVLDFSRLVAGNMLSLQLGRFRRRGGEGRIAGHGGHAA
jgi:crotonobetainyl-CoA:carnitine CoA-transferase CaiB-like acyl-CoA transferase